MDSVSAIKLIRTDTTLDLSQKAEKGMPDHRQRRIYVLFYNFRLQLHVISYTLM